MGLFLLQDCLFCTIMGVGIYHPEVIGVYFWSGLVSAIGVKGLEQHGVIGPHES